MSEIWKNDPEFGRFYFDAVEREGDHYNLKHKLLFSITVNDPGFEPLPGKYYLFTFARNIIRGVVCEDGRVIYYYSRDDFVDKMAKKYLTKYGPLIRARNACIRAFYERYKCFPAMVKKE